MSATDIAPADTAWREMTPYETGFRDGYDRRPKAAPADTDTADLNAYADGYGDGCQLRDDERLEQMMNIYADETCALRDLWFT